MDCFVLPSCQRGRAAGHHASHGAGLPVISTRVGAIDEVVSEGKTGVSRAAQGFAGACRGHAGVGGFS